MALRIVTRGFGGGGQSLIARGAGVLIFINGVATIVARRIVGGTGASRKKVVLEKEQCFRINVVFEAINSDNLDNIESCVERCYSQKNELSIRVKDLDSKMISKEPPDPIKVEALLLWIKKR